MLCNAHRFRLSSSRCPPFSFIPRRLQPCLHVVLFSPCNFPIFAPEIIPVITSQMPEKIFTLKSALYIVPTPIGNVDDITVRALKTLRAADVLCCEDTRTTGQLLKIYGIEPRRLVSIHEHNEARQAAFIVAEIRAGRSVALMSDAGTPLISDPGARLVSAAISAEIDVVPLPGATAFAPALAASGFGGGEFTFLGFPPHKKGRATFLKRVAEMDVAVILYESPHRVAGLLAGLAEVCGGARPVCVARELTKLHEEILRGTASALAAHFTRIEPRGEFVVIVGAAGSLSAGFGNPEI